MAVIIELFGIPGAGKTTYRAQLVEKLRAAGLEVVDSGPLPRTEGRFPWSRRSEAMALRRVGLCLRNRRVLWWCLNVLRRSPRPFRQKVAAFRFVFVGLERYKAFQRDTSNRVYIIDEGSIQRLFLLLVERDGVRVEVDRRVYINAAPFGDLLIHVQVSPQHALARLAGRDYGLPLRLLELNDRQASLCLAQAAALLAKAAVEATAVPVSGRPPRRLTQFRGQSTACGGGTSDGHGCP